METLDSPRIYLIDTSSFVVLDELFPIAQWEPLWDFLALKISEGLVKTIEEVEDELKKRFNDLPVTEWVRARSSELRYAYVAEHFEYLTQEVYPKCNGLVNPNSTSTLYADPMLLAVAGRDGLTIVTDEVLKEVKGNTNPLKIKIPNHAKTLDINCISGRYAWTQFLNELGFRVTGFHTGA